MQRNYFIVTVQIFGLLLLIAGVFLGLNFLTKGVLYISIPIALLIGAIAQILVINLCKQKRATSNLKAAKKMQSLLLGLYAIVIIVTIPFFLHFITVSIKDKSEIQEYYKKDIATFKVTTDNFKREVLTFKGLLKQDLENKSVTSIDQQVDRTIKPLQDNYNEVTTKSQDYITRFTNALDYWNLFTIGNYVEGWNRNKSAWENQLTAAYDDVNKNSLKLSKSFRPKVSDNQEMTSLLYKINWAKGAWLITFLLLAVVHLLMLIEYLTIKAKAGPGKIRSYTQLDSGTDTF